MDGLGVLKAGAVGWFVGLKACAVGWFWGALRRVHLDGLDGI